MARTRIMVIALALIAAVGLGGLIGGLAGGSNDAAVSWTPPASTVTAPATAMSALQPTVVVPVGSSAPVSSPVMAEASPVASASPVSQASPVVGS